MPGIYVDVVIAHVCNISEGMQMSVFLVNCFEIPAGRSDAFFALWLDVNTYMTGKPGYLGHRMHRSLGEDARFRYINYAKWETVEAWRSAHDDGFRALLSKPAWREFPPLFAMYEVVHEVGTV